MGCYKSYFCPEVVKEESQKLQVPAQKNCWSWESAGGCLRKTRKTGRLVASRRWKSDIPTRKMACSRDQHWQKLIICWIRVHQWGHKWRGLPGCGDAGRHLLGRWEMWLKPRYQTEGGKKEDWGVHWKRKGHLPNKMLPSSFERALNYTNRKHLN